MILLSRPGDYKFSVRTFIYFFFLQIAILNAVLRLGEESDVTLFRILLPFIMAVFLLQNKKSALIFFLSFLIFVFFQVISFIINKYPFTFVQFAFSIHFLTLVFIFLLAKKMFKKNEKGWFYFLYVNQVLLLIGLSVQFVLGVSYPNVPLRDNGLNGWYWNHNDTSLALASFVMLSIYKRRIKKDAIITIWAIAIIMFNDSRGAIAGIVIFYILLFLYDFFSIRRKETFYLSLSLFLFVLVLVTVGLLSYEPIAEKVFYVLSMIASIFQLNISYDVIDSDQVRAMAMIYALREIIDSFFIGIGAGNSILMLASGKYPVIEVIKSIHNMPIQIVLELGVVLVIFALVSLKRAIGMRWGLLLIVLVGYLFCSLTQSGGFLVNYFSYLCFLTCLFDLKSRGYVLKIDKCAVEV